MNDAAADFFHTAQLAETIASDLATAAVSISGKGNSVARALLKEARRHTIHAIWLRAQAGAQRGTMRDVVRHAYLTSGSGWRTA